MRTIPLLAAALLPACGQVDQPDGTVEGRVKFVAQTANAAGLRDVTAITAEGRTLVMKMNSGANVPGRVSDAEMLKAVRGIACANDGYRSLIDEGAAIRFELTTADGKPLPTATVSYCPPV